MKKRLALLALVGTFALPVSSALATTYTFSSVDSTTKSGNADINDLAHGYYYGWSIASSDATALGKELANGSTIQSATLVYKNIWNWDAHEKDQLNSFLLSSPPPVPGKSETVPVVIDGVEQGKTAYTYTKTTTSSRVIKNTTGNIPTAPVGYVFASKTWNGNTWTFVYTRTTTSTKTNATGIVPAGYTLTATKFIADTVTLGDGVKLSNNLWERSDQESKTDISWGIGVLSTRIQDIDGDPTNPWDDPLGGKGRNFNLTYNFDDASLKALFEYALDGQFGIGIDPDCHYYNDGIYFTVVTADAPVPEPSTFILFGAGLAGVAFMRRKNRK